MSMSISHVVAMLGESGVASASQASATTAVISALARRSQVQDEETSLKGSICDPDDFDGVNLFENLDSDPLFGKVPKCVVSNYHMRPTQALATAFKKTVYYILEDQPRLFDIDQHYNLRA
ncbi:hypothetical protein BASA50_006170 [Batrachochytrium salamandrivorans]|uniref:Uncharacterized protein n=1 Tax=Batrachochytrium salamandrivorans TaxID=1357716 RepID=A0ABQ8FDL6_9FUNG|nr:hypothetical protein BASA50_006170 [Batrachochytrium salamandrivorans]